MKSLWSRWSLFWNGEIENAKAMGLAFVTFAVVGVAFSIVVIAMAGGRESPPEFAMDYGSQIQAFPSVEKYHGNTKVGIKSFEEDGHKYVLAVKLGSSQTGGVSIVHSPACKCHKESE